MNANELRIGNLITDEFYDSFKTIIKVNSINEHGIDLYIEDDGDYPECAKIWIDSNYKFHDLRPIPLTEEWLVKFGFMQNGNHWTNLIIDLDYITQENYFEYEIQFPFLDWVKRDLKYVHQLQNLYFVLTGEELTIQL